MRTLPLTRLSEHAVFAIEACSLHVFVGAPLLQTLGDGYLMPTFKLTDRRSKLKKGDTPIICAAQRVGVDIPHYCWHPGWSVAGELPDVPRGDHAASGAPGARARRPRVGRRQRATTSIQKKPKLQPALPMAVTEGLEVKSASSPHVERARASVQELLLLNHPVDCPICDQAGECRLQDYWLEHQATSKRMKDEPVHKPKAVVFGPTIVYDAERCIVCTRCIRFSDEVAKDPVLALRQRGNLNEITVAPGRQLDHPYTLMWEYREQTNGLALTCTQDVKLQSAFWFLRKARIRKARPRDRLSTRCLDYAGSARRRRVSAPSAWKTSPSTSTGCATR